MIATAYLLVGNTLVPQDIHLKTLEQLNEVLQSSLELLQFPNQPDPRGGAQLIMIRRTDVAMWVVKSD